MEKYEMTETRQEFEKDLKSGNITEKYLKMSPEELQSRFGDEILKVVNYGNQNNFNHQYELFEHILITVDAVQSNELSEEELLEVRIAAFFHDIGKPNVAKVNEKTGQTQFIGHAKESGDIADNILEGLGYSDTQREGIRFLIQCHDDFINISKVEDVTPEKISKIFISMQKRNEKYGLTITDMKELLVLCKADAMAQNSIIKKNDEVIDTRESRLERLEAIEDILPEALVLKQQQEIDKLIKQKETLINGPKPVEKKGRIVNQKQIDLWREKTDEEKETEANAIEDKIDGLKDEQSKILETDESDIEKVILKEKFLHRQAHEQAIDDEMRASRQALKESNS